MKSLPLEVSKQVSGQPDVIRLALSRVLGWLASRGSFQPKLFYDKATSRTDLGELRVYL